MKTKSKTTVNKTGHDFEALHGALKELRKQMPFLITVPPGERRKLKYGGAPRLDQAVASLAAARANPAVLPPAFDMGRFAEDVTQASQLQGLLNEMRSIVSDLQDTLHTVGSRAVQSGRQVRTVVKALARNTPGMKSVTQSLESPSSRLTKRPGTTGEPAPAVTKPAPETPAQPDTQAA